MMEGEITCNVIQSIHKLVSNRLQEFGRVFATRSQEVTHAHVHAIPPGRKSYMCATYQNLVCSFFFLLKGMHIC